MLVRNSCPCAADAAATLYGMTLLKEDSNEEIWRKVASTTRHELWRLSLKGGTYAAPISFTLDGQ